ncbi:MAG: hypothetical protein ACO1OB_23125, partial [Archangium sp.]
MKRLALSVFFVLAGCDTAVVVDPEGHRCDGSNACPEGYACIEGSCRKGVPLDPTCDGVTCDEPPATTCTTNKVLRTFAGRCVSGQCRYDPVDTTCVTSCANAACVDACQGVSCVTPPSTACVDADTLRTFAMTGTCADGDCDYAQTDTACPNGCENASCKGVDLCVTMNVMCTTPPAPVCVNGARRVFTAPGTCEPGTGQCNYQSTDTPCPNGCAVGVCLMPSLSFTQVGPRVRFAINGLDVAPGSSGNSALAVGSGGKLARWDGAQWTELTTPSTSNLNAVNFVTGTVAYVVGSANTVYTVRPSTNAVTPVQLAGSAMTDLRFVSGRAENEVLIADANGGWWRNRAGMWSNGTLPPANAPWVIRGIQMDETQRERLAGSCADGATRKRCVSYRNLGGTATSFNANPDQPGTFTAIGGGFDVPSNAFSQVLTGLPENTLRTHFQNGVYGNEATNPAMTGTGVVGITAQNSGSGRDVYVLTSSAPATGMMSGVGHLYRLVQPTIGTVTANDALTTYFGEEALSPNDANGVLVAEVRRAAKVNNVFRRGPVTNEALDVGEDFVGASVDAANALVLASVNGDVVLRGQSSHTFEFRRTTNRWNVAAVEARNGTGVLLVGRSGGNGLIVRNVGSMFTTLATSNGAPLNAVCRVSDSEGWAVGDGGVIYRVTNAGAQLVTSPTMKDLLAVDCAVGVAVAVGADGTVIRFGSGTWAAVTPAFPSQERLTAVQLVQGGAFVGNDGIFASYGGQGWSTLPSVGG